MKPISPERLIIRDLFRSSNGLIPITFYRRYKISPDILDDVLTNLEHKGFAVYDNTRIKITPTGKKWILLNPQILIESNKSWRKIPDEFKVTKIEVNTPYIPNVNLLDKSYSLFNLEKLS